MEWIYGFESNEQLVDVIWSWIWWFWNQGFASGSLDQDASSVRRFVERGMEVLVAQSYSKNLGLYAERVGAINAVVSSAQVADK